MSFKVVSKDGKRGLRLSSKKPDLHEVANAVNTLFQDYRNVRKTREDVWAECWAAYMGTPEATEYMNANVAKIVGDVNVDWRHKINTGKAFEIVETVVGYLMSAIFPNSDWFSFVPREAGVQDIARAATKFVSKRLDDARFKPHMEMYVRQAVITGMSCMCLPYRSDADIEHEVIPVDNEFLNPLTGQMEPVKEYKDVLRERSRSGMDFSVASMFDIWIEPHRQLENANIIRRLRMDAGEVVEQMATGFYPELTADDVSKFWGKSDNEIELDKADLVESFFGVPYHEHKDADVIEFWGDVHLRDSIYRDVVVTLVNGKVARFEPNPYWGGKPFVIGNCVPVPTQSYGFGVLEPVLGSLHELNIITNQRLDNLEMTLDNMWEVVRDNVLDPDSLYARPGGMIPVSEGGSIRPLLNNQTNNAYVSYQEASFMEGRIDKTTGAGAYVGPGQGRKGERVTAQEIQAVRDAGGNRLSSIHAHISETQLLPMVEKTYLYHKQFERNTSTVRMPMQGGMAYVEFGPEELTYNFDISLMGAEYVAREEYELEKMMAYIQLVSGNQEFAQRVDWDELLTAVTSRFNFKNLDWELFIRPAEQPQQQGMPQGPESMEQQMAAIQNDAMAAGGKPMVNALDASLNMRGVEGTLDAAMGQ